MAFVTTAAATATRTNITSANADTLISASNQNRKGMLIANESTAILYLLLGEGVASATNYTYSVPATATTSTTITIPDSYVGMVRGLWAAANGFARVTELT